MRITKPRIVLFGASFLFAAWMLVPQFSVSVHAQEAAPSTASLQSDHLPPAQTFLFWKPSEQVVGYRNIDKIFPVGIVKRGATVKELVVAPDPLNVSYEAMGHRQNTDSFMQDNHVSGLLVLSHGRIVLERYGLGRDSSDRWTSFSVGKSVTSTLVGAAIKDGAIAGLEAPITAYFPELRGTAYDGVTVRDLITMRSGVGWSEDYADPKSDVNRFAYQEATVTTGDPIVSYLAKLRRVHTPGKVFNYSTGETDLMGLLLSRATHQSLSADLTKIWSRIGTEQDAVWMLDAAGHELGGCCISMTLRDYARFGLFFMHGGLIGGRPTLPDGWVTAASSPQTATDFPGMGYGYSWWTHSNGSYEAIGIFGQSIYLDPAKDLVIVINSAWPKANAQDDFRRQAIFQAAVVAALCH